MTQLEAQPGNAHARVALAETLLALGRYADAAAEAASVDAEAPCAAAWERSRTGTFVVTSEFRRTLADGRGTGLASSLLVH